MTDKLVWKWGQTGLLELLSPTKKKKCADSLEKMALVLVKKYSGHETPESASICGTLLPVVRRLYDERVKTLPTASWLHNHYVKYLKSNPLETNVCTQCHPDYEADYVNDYVKVLVKKLRK